MVATSLPRAMRLLLITFWIAAQAFSFEASAQSASAARHAQPVPALEAKVKAGDAQAQYELARRHASGDGVPVDKETAFALYTAAAEKGHAQAEYEVARYYRGLHGGRWDLQKAFAYTSRAAEHGYGPAQVDLAFLYFNGNNQVPKNLALSFKWFQKAAANGMVQAQCMMGDFYRNGLGGAPQNEREAFKWYKLTATKKDKCSPKSQYELYVSYEAGRGVEKNLETAINWLKQAAESGNRVAQYALGRNYQKGHGVAQDHELARRWLLKSREGVAPHEDHVHDYDRLAQSQPIPQPVAGQYRNVTWQELVAPGWNPTAITKDLQIDSLNDGDPRAREAMSKLREAWNKAPVNPALNGAAVRIAGYIVPLDAPGDAQKEFLLVPYFGACIHTPPPPANQIIHVVSDKALKGVGEMYAVWARGTLTNTFIDTAMGSAGYRMKLADIKPYAQDKSR